MNNRKILFLADVYNYSERDQFRLISFFDAKADNEIKVATAAVPHGVLYAPVLLGTILQNAGFDVTVLECAFHPFQRLRLQRKLEEQPAIICVTTTFYADADEMSRHIEQVRRLCPGSKVIFGGPTLNWNKAMRELPDVCVYGEGEEVIVPLIERLLSGTSFEDLPNLAFKKKDGSWQENPRQLMKSMDDNPAPNWSLLKRYPNDFFSISTQRGCKWRCAFCTYPGNEGWKLRYRSIPSLITELKSNYESFGIYRYMISDSTFTHPYDRCLELLRAVAKLPFKVEWIAYVRVDTITEELADAMRDSGCVGVFIGVESGDDEVLKKMRKGFTASQVRNSIQLLKDRDIAVTTSWIIGFPGETKASVQRTLDLILALKSDHSYINTFIAEDASPLGYRPEQFGITGMGIHWKHETMNSETASELTSFVVKKVCEAGLLVGSVFDMLWMSSIGYGPKTATDFFARFQRISGGDEADRIRLRPEVDKIYASGRRHPIFHDDSGPLAQPAPSPLQRNATISLGHHRAAGSSRSRK
ncbi:MAG: B12-binding domain-containing radical SAM protein [Bdellovibrionota bacterium]